MDIRTSTIYTYNHQLTYQLIAELAKAKGNIRRKYSALKLGDAKATTIVSRTLKPIIDPLEKKYPLYTYQNNQLITRNTKKKNFESWFKSQAKDWIYDPKKLSNGTIRLVDKEIKFIDNSVVE
ncbi:uncharacterized protein LOC112679601 [Sipha flava]|uniref:Uncharacterized protein LOC112679601 n=1 Tax=Sipha flava TaxID=143950 RepID=A0A2S2PXL4_9HEMI|nr:uncharacterized protein LOC112679601 [Sipha flava]